ncbi:MULTISPECIES: RDD family protein [unclassified Luteimonas]
MRPAGFWRRSAAWSIDAALVALPVLALSAGRLRVATTTLLDAWSALVDAVAQRMATAIIATDVASAPHFGALFGMVQGSMRDPALLAAAAELQSAILALAGPPLGAFIALFLAWCVGFERSPLRATPGKRALGLRVATANGGDPGTGAVLLRFVSGALSWLSLNVGHMLAAVPPGHAALHDRLSRTRVVLGPGVTERMPRWAAAWLVLLGVLLLLATAWGSAAMAFALQSALDRALWG